MNLPWNPLLQTMPLFLLLFIMVHSDQAKISQKSQISIPANLPDIFSRKKNIYEQRTLPLSPTIRFDRKIEAKKHPYWISKFIPKDFYSSFQFLSSAVCPLLALFCCIYKLHVARKSSRVASSIEQLARLGYELLTKVRMFDLVISSAQSTSTARLDF